MLVQLCIFCNKCLIFSAYKEDTFVLPLSLEISAPWYIHLLALGPVVRQHSTVKSRLGSQDAHLMVGTRWKGKTRVSQSQFGSCPSDPTPTRRLHPSKVSRFLGISVCRWYLKHKSFRQMLQTQTTAEQKRYPGWREVEWTSWSPRVPAWCFAIVQLDFIFVLII